MIEMISDSLSFLVASDYRWREIKFEELNNRIFLDYDLHLQLNYNRIKLTIQIGSGCCTHNDYW